LGLWREGLLIRKHPVRIICAARRLHLIRSPGDVRGLVKGFGNGIKKSPGFRARLGRVSN
jgi:hypothetical protein